MDRPEVDGGEALAGILRAGIAGSDSAGATHAFAAACRDRGVGFSFDFPVGWRMQTVVDAIP